MNHLQRGLTLIELIIGMTIIAILASIAVPSFSNMNASQEVAGAAEKIYQNLLFARSESVKQNKNIHVSVTTGSSWCYGFTDSGSSCSCGTSGSCTVNGAEKVVSSSEYKNITLAVGGSLNINGSNFNSTRGSLERNGSALNDGTITISRGGNSATISINALGRPSICSNSLSQFSSC